MAKKKSIITSDLEHCFVCGKPDVAIHHVFEGSYRQLSDKYFCVVPLCWDHHTGPQGVHFNKSLDRMIKEVAQRCFEENYGKTILEVFGKNFV